VQVKYLNGLPELTKTELVKWATLVFSLIHASIYGLSALHYCELLVGGCWWKPFLWCGWHHGFTYLKVLSGNLLLLLLFKTRRDAPFWLGFWWEKAQVLLKGRQIIWSLHQISFISTSHVLPPVDWLVEDDRSQF